MTIDIRRTADRCDAEIGDGTAGRAPDEHDFTVHAKRWLKPDMTVLEVESGDGTWTLRLAPLVGTLIVVSSAEQILGRTRERCEALGIHNVEYVLASDPDATPVPDQCIDLFFRGDAVARTALDLALPGATEIVRVLKPGAICVSRYDVGDQPDSSGATEAGNQYRDRADTLGRPCYASAEMLNQIYEHVGLRVFAVHQEGSCCTVLAMRTADSIGARAD